MRKKTVKNQNRKIWFSRLDDYIHKIREQRAISHGKIPVIIPYIGYGSSEWIRVLARVLYFKPNIRKNKSIRPNEEQVWKIRGWRSFTSVHVPFATVTITTDSGEEFTAKANSGGVVDVKIPVNLKEGWHTVTLKTSSGDSVTSEIYVVGSNKKFGIISDVDDTVMITMMPRPLVAAWNAFARHEQARTATPGMSVLLDRLRKNYSGAPVIYLSTGAWNVAPALTRFLSRNLYPLGPLLLTDWGPTPERFFRSGTEHKRNELKRIAKEFPDIKWLLIGDDGQHDETLYKEFANENPNNVVAIAIRQLTPGEMVLSGARKHSLESLDSEIPIIYGPDGATIANELGKVLNIPNLDR